MGSFEDQDAKASAKILLATTWSLFGTATLLFTARIVVRCKYASRVFVDDGLAAIALTCLLVQASLLTIMLESLYIALHFEKEGASREKRSTAPNPSKLVEIDHFLHYELGFTMVNLLCLWSVKASFLAFFKRLTNNLRAHTFAWYAIVVFTALAFCAAMLSYPIACGNFQGLSCMRKDTARRSLISLTLGTVLDVITDALIIALPFSLAWRVQLPLRTKLALFGVFSLGGLVAVFAIIRLVLTKRRNAQPEISWLNLWSIVEAGVACIVCNLASFKVLFHGRIHSSFSEPYRRSGPEAKSAKQYTTEKETMSTARSESPPLPGGEDFGTSRTKLTPDYLPRHARLPSLETEYLSRPAAYPQEQQLETDYETPWGAYPEGRQFGTMRTLIRAGSLGENDPRIRREGIVVTREVDRIEEAPAGQVTMTRMQGGAEKRLRAMAPGGFEDIELNGLPPGNQSFRRHSRIMGSVEIVRPRK